MKREYKPEVCTNRKLCKKNFNVIPTLREGLNRRMKCTSHTDLPTNFYTLCGYSIMRDNIAKDKIAVRTIKIPSQIFLIN